MKNTNLLSRAALASLLAGPALAGASPEAVPARDAGIRYGQAAGVALVCVNMHATTKAEQLSKAYAGAELDQFNQQAQTVLSAWKTTLTCEKTGDPNQCRIIHQMSCAEAIREIGPTGNKLPGLVEYKAQ